MQEFHDMLGWFYSGNLLYDDILFQRGMKAIKTNLYKQLSVKSQTFNIVKVQQTGILCYWMLHCINTHFPNMVWKTKVAIRHVVKNATN